MQVINPHDCLHAPYGPRLVQYGFEQQSAGIGVAFRAREGRVSELVRIHKEGRC